MTQSAPLINEVLLQLEHEQLIDAQWQTRLSAELDTEAEQSPWYVRVFVALGAWVASFFLLGFVALLGLLLFENHIRESSVWWLGLFSIGLAVWMHQAKTQEFFQQFALALVMSGEIMLMIGIMISFDHMNNYSHAPQTATTPLIMMMLSQILLVFIYQDRIVQFLAFIAVSVELVLLVYFNEAAIAIHAVLFVLALGFAVLMLNEAKLYSQRHAEMLLTLKYALLIAVMIGMTTSTIYVIPDAKNVVAFPIPWISTLSMSGILAFALARIMANAGFAVRESIKIVSYVAVVCLAAVSWQAPGLVLSLLVLLLGFATANRLILGIAIAFFIFFLTTFFYGIEISLLHKSYTLIGTGALLLGGWYLLRLQGRTLASQETTHA